MELWPVADDAVLDACVLIPMALCDLLLRVASAGLFNPRWSEDILEEVGRNLVGKCLTDRAGAAKRIAAMRGAFRKAMVEGHRGLIDHLSIDPEDRHLLAAAFVAEVSTIVTHNVLHFPEAALVQYGIRAVSPDAFLLSLDDIEQSNMLDVVERQPADMRTPPITVDDLLDGPSRQIPSFAQRLRPRRGRK